MQTKFLLFFFAIIISACAINKPNQAINDPKEEALIRKTIDTYFEGWMTGDTTKLGKAMHATCQLKNVKDNEVLIFDRAKYLSFFKPRPRRKNAGGNIISIDITNDIAAAKCKIFTADRLYIDYFNMMKINDEWYIVDKIATNWLKDEATKQ